MARELFRLSDRERDLLLRYCDFYLALASGARRPTTEAQRHFVAVCRGETDPITDHERTFINFKRLVTLSGMTVRQVIENRFRVEVPMDHRAPEPKRPEPLPTPATEAPSVCDWRQMDEFGEGVPRPGWFSDEGWRRMRSGYRFDSRD